MPGHALLKPGDEMKCWRCSDWHVLEASLYATWMLFITCAGGRYYAGTIGVAPDQPTRPSGDQSVDRLHQ